LVKYDGKTGQVLVTYDFVPGSCDPHGLEFHNGSLISCDAGIHPGWPLRQPSHGWIFRSRWREEALVDRKPGRSVT